MAISTYTELQTAVSNWAERDDLSSRIPEFITLAESDINNIARLTAQETTASVSMVAGQLYNSLPTGFMEVIDFYYKQSVDDVDERLEKLSVDELNEIITTDTSSRARPRYYAISDTLLYEIGPDTTYAPVMRYWKKWDIASDSTNWLLTNHPNAYLYGALTHAAPFLIGDERIMMFKSLFQEKLDLLSQLSSRARKSSLRVDAGLLKAGRGRIYEGR